MTATLLDDSTPAQFIPYMDLGGGLNNRKDPHALAPNEWATLINGWPAYDQAVMKRPGNAALVTNTGAIGNLDGSPCISLLSARFNNTTYLVACRKSGNVWASAITGLTWTKIGTVNKAAKFCTSAQMMDPSVGANGTQIMIICDGIGIPQYWAGPGSQLVAVATGTSAQYGAALPTTDAQGNSPIAPQFVQTLGNNSHLFYSGVKSQPSAVYISDPFYPQYFNSPAMQVASNQAVTPAEYVPAIIGNNDGVQGGDITGLMTLGSAMMTFKESAVYALLQTTLLGEIPAWQVVTVSNSTGCLSPLSIVAFDMFICFLAIDGVYATDGNAVWQISGDVPAFFDSTLNGQLAQIVDRTTAKAARHGYKYEIFFVGFSAPVTTGVWFDFSKQSAYGNPLAGQIEGMNVGSLVSLRGPYDDGNIAWSDAVLDRIGRFGVGSSDFGQAISFAGLGKADLMDSTFGPTALISEKQVQDAYALVQLLGQQATPSDAKANQVAFAGALIVDNATTLEGTIPQPVQQIVSTASGIWGTGQWGTMKWNANTAVTFAIIKIPLPTNARGHLHQIGIAESSTIAWILIGYVVYANLQPPSY